MTTKAVAASVDPTFGKRLILRNLAVLALAVACMVPLHASLAAENRQAVERDAFLSAVAEVETGGNSRAIGRRGERGLYQFTRATWQRHSSRPFAEAHNPAVAYGVAVRHFDWLHDRIVTSGREPTTYRLAVAWNAGLNRALSGSPPRSTRDYARRVSNLATVLQPSVRPAAPALVTLVAAGSAVPTASPLSVASRAAPVSLSTAETAPDVVPISFSLDDPDVIALDQAAVTGVVGEPVEEISFTLARPGATTTNAPRRFIFATIGE